MFYALAKNKIDPGNYEFQHELVDIETLNRRALKAELELTAISLHAYAQLDELYILCSCGASVGDGYGPIVVTRQPVELASLRDKTFAIPGTMTTAYLALRLCLGNSFSYVIVPFDEILEATAAGQYAGRQIDAGLVIHEGQLTYMNQQLHSIVDLGVWWKGETGLPLPLGANALRRDLGTQTHVEVNQILGQSIRYALDHREEALAYALSFGRGLDQQKADSFVGMYVNDWTLDFGDRGRESVRVLLEKAYEAGVVSKKIVPDFIC